MDVKKEMTDEKGLSPEVTDKIGEYVKLKGQSFPPNPINSQSDEQPNRGTIFIGPSQSR